MSSSIMEKKSSLPAAVTKHYYLHHKSSKIAASHFRFALAATIFAIGFDILLLLTKDKFLAYASRKHEEFSDWNRFFSLKDWIQWTILGTMTCWFCLEIGIAKLLQYAVRNESRPHLQVWLILYTVDVLVSCGLLVILIFIVIPSTKILLGIIGIVFFIMELYYFSILYRYFISLKTTARYEVCQVEDDKISVTC